MADMPDMPPSRVPPTDGPVVSAPAPEINIANQNDGTPMAQAAELPDLAGTTAAAVSAGEAWNAGAGQMLNSPAGFGLDGYILTDPGAAPDWPTGMMFPHEGPP